MKFEQMQYARPDFDAARETFASLRARIAAAPDAQAQLEAFREFETLSRHISTMSTLAEIRHTVDTRDAFYEAEREFFDANSPALGEAQLDVYRALLASPFRTQLEQALGRLTFEKMEVDVKSSDPAILELMAEENALTTAYEKLYASALIEFDGRKNTVSQMSLYKQNPDRAVRKAAYEAEGAWFDAHRAELDELYDKLVKNRTAQARKLGYENFIPLGAIRMRRIGYTLEDMAAYRAQIKKDFVPVVAELKKLQYARKAQLPPQDVQQGKRQGGAEHRSRFVPAALNGRHQNAAEHGLLDDARARAEEKYRARRHRRGVLRRPSLPMSRLTQQRARRQGGHQHRARRPDRAQPHWCKTAFLRRHAQALSTQQQKPRHPQRRVQHAGQYIAQPHRCAHHQRQACQKLRAQLRRRQNHQRQKPQRRPPV